VLCGGAISKGTVAQGPLLTGAGYLLTLWFMIKPTASFF
jgi:hypothetical protein